MGAPPSAVIGVRNALERGPAAGAVPVGSALLGTVLAVLALCGTAVFGASLSHLTATPRLYGDAFQLNFTDPAGGRPDPVLLRSLEHNKAVTGITEGVATEISVNQVAVGAIAGTAIRGQLLLSTVNGHLPIADDQIGLGGTTMRQVGAHVGSLVHVTVSVGVGARRTRRSGWCLRSPSRCSEGTVSLGSGAVITTAGYEDAVCPRSSGRAACIDAALATTNGGGMLVRVVPGARGKAAINHYLDSYRSTTVLANTPTSLINFGEAVNFPLIFGAMLAVVGAATLAHLLVVSVARRRREIGLLKVLGFVNRQVASAVAWQATTVALIGIIIGVPLGVVVGRGDMERVRQQPRCCPGLRRADLARRSLVVGVLVVANLLAIGPALVATRSKPASLLRAPQLNAV